MNRSAAVTSERETSQSEVKISENRNLTQFFRSVPRNYVDFVLNLRAMSQFCRETRRFNGNLSAFRRLFSVEKT